MMTERVNMIENRLQKASCKQDFMNVCRDIVENSAHVKIDRKAVEAYAASLRVPAFIPGWDEYLTPRNKSLWSRTDDFIELAVNTSINAGYLYADEAGQTAKWEKDGSGAKALQMKMDEIRNLKALPALHLKTPQEVQDTLSTAFEGAPFAAERLEIWAELAQPHVTKGLRDLLYSTRETTRSRQHHFTFDHILGLKNLCPKAFGSDPFLKKAALLPILFAGVAHNRIAPGAVTMESLVAADYRVPQTNHNIGMLRFSDALVDRLDREELMAETDSMVMEIRAATWVVEEMTLSARLDIQSYHLDGEKWFAGRLFDKPLDRLDEKKQKIRNHLEAIGDKSGFDVPGFNRRATRPMAVSTMRF